MLHVLFEGRGFIYAYPPSIRLTPAIRAASGFFCAQSITTLPMRNSICLNQLVLVGMQYELSADDAIILSTVVQLYNLPTANKTVIEGKTYLQVSPGYLVEQVPISCRKDDSAYRRLMSLSKRGWLTAHPLNKKNRTSYYELSIITVGLFSDTQSDKHPTFGQTSDIHSEHYPTNPEIKSDFYPTSADFDRFTYPEAPIIEPEFVGLLSDDYRSNVSLETKKEKSSLSNAGAYPYEGGEAVSVSAITQGGVMTELESLVAQYRAQYPRRYHPSFYADFLNNMEIPATKYPDKMLWQVMCRGLEKSLWLSRQIHSEWERNKQKYTNTGETYVVNGRTFDNATDAMYWRTICS